MDVTDQNVRRLLLLTDDNFIADALGNYMHGDEINVERVECPNDIVRSIGGGADGVVIDLSKRGMTGDAIMNLTTRAQRWEIPVFIMSAQPRNALMEFVAVVRATDAVSKTEPMTTIAARIRMRLRTPVQAKQKSIAMKTSFAIA